jgi:hypothetical protein
MDKFDNSKNQSYEKARKIEYKAVDHVKFIWNMVLIVVKVIGVLIVEAFFNFLHLFKDIKPKDISGQLALVTGLHTNTIS